MATEEWLKNTQKVLLDCPHHHVIFTLPEEMNVLWRFNQSVMTDLLFKAVQQTLQQFGQDSRYLNAMPGVLSALHTWGRNLSLHPHLHVLISHGGIGKHGQWVEPRKKILYPRRPVMMVYRGIMRKLVSEALGKEDWVNPPNMTEQLIRNTLNKIGHKEWVVHFCERYDHADGVAKYLSRYVKSGPFKNQQLVNVTQTSVSFKYSSHQTKRIETLTLSVDEFIKRLLQHVPLPKKPTVRYSGLYNSATRKKLNVARKELGQKEVSQREMLDWQAYLEERGSMPTCKECGEKLIKEKSLQKKNA